jgi:NAD(P)-dependent dehydrogenase (short-subunit alcohol dehydrogenase family)
VLAEEVRRRHQRLHVLINNAGLIGASRRRLTADGLEETFAVNHLATFLLTTLLLDRLVAAAPARVVTVSSEAHRSVRAIDFDDLQAEHRYRSFRAYGQSKLANVLFTRELARRLDGNQVTANCLHPGVVRTGIWATAGGVLGVLGRLCQVFMLSSRASGAYVARLAADPALDGVTGRYFNCYHEARPSAAAEDASAAARLWAVSEQLVAR